MALIRIILNGLIMAAEIAVVGAIAYFGWLYPFVFAGASAALALIVGMRLEYQRIAFEFPFYFEAGRGPRLWFAWLVGFSESFTKALLAGVAAVLTFAGTDANRLWLVAIVFALSVYFGAWMLRSISYSFGARPGRWGYFRLAAPLGIVFSTGIAILVWAGSIPQPSISDISLGAILHLPQQPSIAQMSELVFQLKQAFDAFVVRALGVVLPAGAAEVVGILLSVNMLTGFVSALYASIIAAGVRSAEDALL